MNPYKPTAGVVEYETVCFGPNAFGHLEDYDIKQLNALARDGWRIVSSTTVNDRRVLVFLERKLHG